MHVTEFENEMNRRVADRRVKEIDFKRRRFDRRLKTFMYQKTVHLSDTNAFGSVYFARFFDFQGETREEFLQYFMGKDLAEFINKGFGIVTIEAQNKYKVPLFVYDRIVIKLQVLKIKRTKVNVSITIEKISGELAAKGEQWLGFTDHNGRAIPIPEIVLRNLERFEIT